MIRTGKAARRRRIYRPSTPAIPPSGGVQQILDQHRYQFRPSTYPGFAVNRVEMGLDRALGRTAKLGDQEPFDREGRYILFGRCKSPCGKKPCMRSDIAPAATFRPCCMRCCCWISRRSTTASNPRISANVATTTGQTVTCCRQFRPLGITSVATSIAKYTLQSISTVIISKIGQVCVRGCFPVMVWWCTCSLCK